MVLRPAEWTPRRGSESAGALEVPSWRMRAACRDVDPDWLFVRGKEQHRAKLVCMGCAVRTECLAEALDKRIEFGVWGGMTERERRALLRRRPDVSSWHGLLDSARRDYQRDCDCTEDCADAAS